MESPADSEFESSILHGVFRCGIIISAFKERTPVGIYHKNPGPLDLDIDKYIHIHIVPDFLFILKVV